MYLDDPLPMHSNLHTDMRTIQSTNQQHIADQLHSRDTDSNMFDPYLERRPTSSFSNTQPYDNLNATLYNLQYDRYCNHGGTLSPVSTKPTIDTIALINATWPLGTYPYCQHFHQNVTPHYYSLGRATTEWKHWLNYTDPSP